MTDTNHHVLTGKVDITSNLLVGSSHLFVDTNNNRVGLVTTNPDAGLHVNSNAYVNTDLRVGSQIEINATAGHVKAGSFEGDGSLLQNTPPGADGAAATIAVGTTTTGLAGTDASVTNSGTSSAAVFDFVIPRGEQGIQGNPGNDGADGADGSNGADGAPGTDGADGANGADGADGADGANGVDGTNYFTLSGSNIYRTTGNVGIGTNAPGVALDVVGTIRGTGGIITGTSDALLTLNNTTTPTVLRTLTTGGQVYFQSGVAATSDSRANINFTSMYNATNYLTIQGSTGNVGIGDSDPDSILHVQSDIAGSSSSIKKTAATASTSEYNYILNGPRPGTTSGGAVHFINGSGRSHDGGTSTYTMRNDSGNTRVGKVSTSTIIAGYPSYPDRPFAMVGKNNGRVYSGSFVIFNSQAYNDQSIYNSSNGRFTAPVAGYYMFSATLLAGERETQTNTRWHLNGNELGWGGAHYNFGSGVNMNTAHARPGLTCQMIYYMNSGNYMNLKIVGGSMYGASSIHSTVTCMYMGGK